MRVAIAIVLIIIAWQLFYISGRLAEIAALIRKAKDEADQRAESH